MLSMGSARASVEREMAFVQEEGLAFEARRRGPCDTIMYKIVHNVVWIDMGETNMLQRRGANW